MEIFIIAVFLGLITAGIANSKKRSFIKWFIYGFLLGIIAIPHALIIKNDPSKKCPECYTSIPEGVTICRYCKHKFDAEDFKVLAEKREKNEKHNAKMLAVFGILIVIASVLFYIAYNAGY